MAGFDLSGQVALVSGAARGIGRGCAVALAKAGADIVLGLRDVKADAGAVDEIKSLGRRVLAVQMNVSDLKQINSAVAAANETFGRIDILVNNAGIGPPNLAVDVSERDFDYTMNVNVKGTFFVSQAVGRLMLKRQYGRIVNLSSQAGFVALPSEAIYCMSKAAIAHLTKCLAVEWGPQHITVNAVAPTFIKTPGTEKWLTKPGFAQDVVARIPVGHVGEPSDVATAVVYLASPEARMINGATLMIDGGWTAR
jgi:NAD(P)-dependent dehydrogenase (short-subunit alcohol dehydrogenase family)